MEEASHTHFGSTSPPHPTRRAQSLVCDDESLAVAVVMGLAHDLIPATGAAALTGECASAARCRADLSECTLNLLADAYARHVRGVVSARAGGRPVDPAYATSSPLRSPASSGWRPRTRKG
jgi:hypothetical protein